MPDLVETIVKRLADRHLLRLDVAAAVIREFVFEYNHGIERKALMRCPDCTDGTVRKLSPAGSMDDFECPTCRGFGVIDRAPGDD